MPEPLTSLRADKYLHNVRVFKTRTLATQACDRGNVKLGTQDIKPRASCTPAMYSAFTGVICTLTIKVIAFPPQRLVRCW